MRTIHRNALGVALVACLLPTAGAHAAPEGLIEQVSFTFHTIGDIRGITVLRTADGQTGTLTIQLQGLSGAARHRVVWTSGGCTTAYDPTKRLAGVSVQTDGKRSVFRTGIEVDVSAISFDTWDSGSQWILRGGSGSSALSCAPTRLYDTIDPSPAAPVTADVAVAILPGPKGKGIVVAEQLPGDRLRIRAALQGLPSIKAFRLRGNSGSCSAPYDPTLDDYRLKPAATSTGTAWVSTKVPGRLEYPNLASMVLGGSAGAFDPRTCGTSAYGSFGELPPIVSR